MKDILLTKDGVINKVAIEDFIDSHQNIDAIDYNEETLRYETLLYTAVTCPSIQPRIKSELVSYLINLGAKVNKFDTICYGGLLGFALSHDDLETASVLYENGADITHKYEDNNLIDIALTRCNKEAMLWVMEYAKPLFLLLKPEQFLSYVKKISDYKDPRIDQAIEDIYNYYVENARKTIASKFEKIGLIDSNDMAIVLAAKMSCKSYPNSIFSLNEEDLDSLVDIIKNFLINETEVDVVKFQFTLYKNYHAMFGQFEINKTTTPPIIKYLHCDPLPDTIAYRDVITEKFRQEICPLADIVIADSEYCFQRGAGCTYFSLDGGMMLATPSDRDYVVDVFKHMETYGVEEKQTFKENNIKYIRSTSLPTRLIRGSHDIEDGVGFFSGIKGLKTLVLNSDAKNTFVNKQHQTAETSIVRDLYEKVIPSNSEPSSTKVRTLNLRAERKMKQYGEAVANFLKDKNVLDPAFNQLIDQYKIKGLTEFFKAKMRVSPSFKI